MFGFGKRGRGGGRWGGPGWRRQGWRGVPWWEQETAWPQDAGWRWGGGPGYRWQWEAQQLPPAERRAYLEAFKAHLEARLEEVKQALAELNKEEV